MSMTLKEERELRWAGSETWKTLAEIRNNIQDDFPESVTKEMVEQYYIILNHGQMPGNYFYIAEHFYSRKEDDLGRIGTGYIKTFLLQIKDYITMLQEVRKSPIIAKKIFAEIAPELIKKSTLPGEERRPLILTHREG